MSTTFVRAVSVSVVLHWCILQRYQLESKIHSEMNVSVRYWPPQLMHLTHPLDCYPCVLTSSHNVHLAVLLCAFSPACTSFISSVLGTVLLHLSVSSGVIGPTRLSGGLELLFLAGQIQNPHVHSHLYSPSTIADAQECLHDNVDVYPNVRQPALAIGLHSATVRLFVSLYFFPVRISILCIWSSLGHVTSPTTTY
jgi:hypothetical protein